MMQYIMLAFALIAFVCVMLDLREERKKRSDELNRARTAVASASRTAHEIADRIDIADQERGELMKRVNILDEVVTQHSEELDELQRMTTIRGIVRELEAKSWETVEIK